jgi:hypothetical protein
MMREDYEDSGEDILEDLSYYCEGQTSLADELNDRFRVRKQGRHGYEDNSLTDDWLSEAEELPF